jgi:hypothetical protein
MGRGDFDIPDGLSDRGHKAAEQIVALARNHFGADSSGGGCRAFYTPAEWRERSEEYGLESELIVVHDGGDLAPFFNYDYLVYTLIEKMDGRLRAIDCYAQNCTCWYTAIYRSSDA